jgi:hypothetical protein
VRSWDAGAQSARRAIPEIKIVQRARDGGGGRRPCLCLTNQIASGPFTLSQASGFDSHTHAVNAERGSGGGGRGCVLLF